MTVVPDHGRRLSDAVLVEGSVRARVLGIRLLALDATVVLVPARLTTSTAGVADLAAPAIGPTSTAPDPPPRTAGRGLAEAVRSIDEGAEILSRADRNGR